METYITVCKIDRQGEFAVYQGLWISLAGGQGGGRPAGRRAEPMQAEALWVAAPTEPWPCDDQ